MSHDIQKMASQALQDVERVFSALAPDTGERMCAAILQARLIACYGVGREGLMMKALCMRLMHLGLDAHMVGDMTTPHLGAGDLLLVSAGPGQFSTVLALMGVARDAGARRVRRFALALRSVISNVEIHRAFLVTGKVRQNVVAELERIDVYLVQVIGPSLPTLQGHGKPGKVHAVERAFDSRRQRH